MKWFFRIIGLVLAAFIALCVIGYFLPAAQRIDASRPVSADRDTIYDVLEDLRSYPEWSGFGGPDSEWVFGGSDFGVGQTAAWQSGEQFGSLSIVQAEPGQFVNLQIDGPDGQHMLMLALSEGAEQTNLLLETERDLGGFPYLGRLAALRQKSSAQDTLDRAASGLADLFN